LVKKYILQIPNESIFFVIGLRSSFDSMNSGRSPNDSERSGTPLTSGQRSITSHENIRLLPNQDPSTQPLSQSHSAVPSSKIITGDLVHKMSFHSRSNIDKVTLNSIKYIGENPSDIRQYNSNAITEHQSSSSSAKQRRYRITVIHSDEPTSQYRTKMEVIFSISLLKNVVYFI